MAAQGAWRWWLVAGGFAIGVAAVGAGVGFVRAGLEDADRWASVLGVFLNLAGVVIAACSAVWARRALRTPAAAEAEADVVNAIRKGRITGAVLQGRDVDLSGTAPTGPERVAPGGVSNRIDGAEVHGTVIQGRDLRGPLPPVAGADQPDGRQP
ncbi:hypothetical protein [Longispora urticae]